jgi:RHS repeat-associated protein
VQPAAGDGARVKSTINGTMTTFVGNHYEVSGSAVTKYYYAGSNRVAMRTNGTLNYLLTDHLGSTSITTDGSGNKVAELRYKAWGETRYSSGTTPTKYQFTGQYSQASEFGLLFYQSRWLDPSLGRFTSADSIVPSGVQGYDRFAYVGNSPVNHTDPSGHCEESDAECRANLSWTLPQPQSPSMPTSSSDTNKSGAGKKPGHHYQVGPHPVCLDWGWINCTDSEVQDYLSRWQYPGQLFWNPVQAGHSYNVFPEKIGNIPTLIGLLWPGSGAIKVEIAGNTLSNATYPRHVFHEGYVERTSSRDANGTPYVTTLGEGTNDGFALVTISMNNVETDLILIPGSYVDAANQTVGPLAFDALDAGLITYTTLVETSQHISSLWP